MVYNVVESMLRRSPLTSTLTALSAFTFPRLIFVGHATESTVYREETRAARLRQSIFKQAFSGTLIPSRPVAAPEDPASDATPGEISTGDGVPPGTQMGLAF